jgi:hypothetical protein
MDAARKTGAESGYCLLILLFVFDAQKGGKQ